MRILGFIAFAITGFAACSLLPESGGDTASAIKTEYLTRHWVHSREEESMGDEVDIYRPHDYKEFPASRFRMQYIFEEDGTLKWFFLAPNDAHYFKSGRWRLDDDEEDVLLLEQSEETASYRVVELKEDLLRMQEIDSEGS